METERSKGEEGMNLKVGSGGLVDLEFLLQALQLQYGGTRRELATTNSFEVVDEIIRQNIVKKGEGGRLSTNLEYLRLLETFVRLNSEGTSFLLPKEKSRLQSLAGAMDERSPQSFLHFVQKKRRENRALFSRIKTLHRE